MLDPLFRRLLFLSSVPNSTRRASLLIKLFPIRCVCACTLGRYVIWLPFPVDGRQRKKERHTISLFVRCIVSNLLTFFIYRCTSHIIMCSVMLLSPSLVIPLCVSLTPSRRSVFARNEGKKMVWNFREIVSGFDSNDDSVYSGICFAVLYVPVFASTCAAAAAFDAVSASICIYYGYYGNGLCKIFIFPPLNR